MPGSKDSVLSVLGWLDTGAGILFAARWSTVSLCTMQLSRSPSFDLMIVRYAHSLVLLTRLRDHLELISLVVSFSSLMGIIGRIAGPETPRTDHNLAGPRSWQLNHLLILGVDTSASFSLLLEHRSHSCHKPVLATLCLPIYPERAHFHPIHPLFLVSPFEKQHARRL